MLHLRAVRPTTDSSTAESQGSEQKPRVRWTNDVIDNEYMNKKKSKICCIFHPQREFGESSDEELTSSSDSSDESDAEVNGENGTSGNKEKKKKHGKHCGHSSPNAYERQPTYTNRSMLPQKPI